jgi:hypothetical protein
MKMLRSRCGIVLNWGRLFYIKLGIFAYFTIFLSLSGCWTYSRLHADFVPPESVRLAETMRFMKKSELLTEVDRYIYQQLINSGIPESSISDKSVGIGRVYCCGGPNEIDTRIDFYIPTGMDVELGDIVEVVGGPQPTDAKPFPHPNTVVRVRQHATETGNTCRWEPNNPLLWQRVLYCDGLEREGWTQQNGQWHFWIKNKPGM